MMSHDGTGRRRNTSYDLSPAFSRVSSSRLLDLLTVCSTWSTTSDPWRREDRGQTGSESRSHLERSLQLDCYDSKPALGLTKNNSHYRLLPVDDRTNTSGSNQRGNMVPGWGWGWGMGGFFPAVHQTRWWVWNHVSVLMSPDLAALSEFFCFLINQVKHHYHFSQLICAEQLQAATPTLGTTDLNPVQTDFGEKKSKTRVDFFSFKNNFFSCLKNPPTLIHWQQRKLVFSNK